MRVMQEEAFKPITLVLETKEEALALWNLIDSKGDRTDEEKSFAMRLSNWFTNRAQL